jgi:hypothetical protein
MPEEVKDYSCPYCSCTFNSSEDLQAHLRAFGTDPVQHVLNLERERRRLESVAGRRFQRV